MLYLLYVDTVKPKGSLEQLLADVIKKQKIVSVLNYIARNEPSLKCIFLQDITSYEPYSFSKSFIFLLNFQTFNVV